MSVVIDVTKPKEYCNETNLLHSESTTALNTHSPTIHTISLHSPINKDIPHLG